MTQSQHSSETQFNAAARLMIGQEVMRGMLAQAPVVPLIGIDKPEQFEDLIQQSIVATPAGRTPAIEILLRSEDAIEAGLVEVKRLKDVYADQVNILIGSVIKPEDVTAAVEAGADGVISGGYSSRVEQAAFENHMPYLPGLMTLDEVRNAYEYGYGLIKLFPASSSSAKAIMAPLERTGVTVHAPDDKGLTVCQTPSQVLLMWEQGETQVILDPADSETKRITDYMLDNGMSACCTGGVTASNLYDFYSKGAVVGVGASFIVKDAAEGDASIKDILNEALTEWERARGGPEDLARVPDLASTPE